MSFYLQHIKKGVYFGYWLLLVLMPALLQAQVSRDCVNGGLELNSFNNFSGFIGTYSGATSIGDVNSGLNLSSTSLPNTNRITLVTPGIDQNAPIQQVYEGNYAIRLGDNAAGSRAERVTYSVPITNSNKIFKYNYAVVLELPDDNHSNGERPFFWARVMVGKQVICETGRKSAGLGDPFFQSNGNYDYRDWDCQVCDLSAYVGQTVTVEFTIADCSLSGHSAYAFIDGLCSSGDIDVSFNLNKEKFCKDEDITMDASATVGETYYYLTLEESDANMGRPNPASEMILHFPNQQTPSVINITDVFQSNGFVFQCNMYYRLKLAVGNDCSQWNELVKLVYISCPQVNAGPDICVDCSKPTISRLLPIGDPLASTASHLQYSWSPSQGISNPSAPYTTHMEHSVGYPITYTLNVIDLKSGCRNSDQVVVQCAVERARIDKDYTCCGIRLLLNAPPDYTYINWSTGESGVGEILVTSAGTYTVTYGNSCSRASSSITITAQDVANIERYYRNLNDPNNHSFYSSGSNLNSYNAFYIMHVEDPLPAYGNYFATHFKFDIYDRWGQIIRTIEDEIETCQGFPNPAIFWDGKVNGVNVPPGVYNGRLYMKNCKKDINSGWIPVRVTYCAQWGYPCYSTDCVFNLTSFQCGFMRREECVSYGPYQCIEQYEEYIFPITIIF